MFVAALFVTAPKWISPDILQKVNSYTVVYLYHKVLLSNKKKKLLIIHDLDESLVIMLSEKSQSSNVVYCMVPFT